MFYYRILSQHLVTNKTQNEENVRPSFHSHLVSNVMQPRYVPQLVQRVTEAMLAAQVHYFSLSFFFCFFCGM